MPADPIEQEIHELVAMLRGLPTLMPRRMRRRIAAWLLGNLAERLIG